MLAKALLSWLQPIGLLYSRTKDTAFNAYYQVQPSRRGNTRWEMPAWLRMSTSFASKLSRSQTRTSLWWTQRSSCQQGSSRLVQAEMFQEFKPSVICTNYQPVIPCQWMINGWSELFVACFEDLFKTSNKQFGSSRHLPSSNNQHRWSMLHGLLW